MDVKGVQGLLRRSQVAYPEKVSDGQEIQVRASRTHLRTFEEPTPNIESMCIYVNMI